jgi:hypothetical protein
LEGHALCTDLVVELDGVDCLEWDPGEREEGTVEENHCDEDVAGACSDVAVGFGSEDVDRNISKSSEESAPEEKQPAIPLRKEKTVLRALSRSGWLEPVIPTSCRMVGI